MSGQGGRKRKTCAAVYCKKDISTDVHIACAVCPKFNLCLHCFSVGFEQGSHRNSHHYRVVDNLRFGLTEPRWRADEEMKLLEVLGKVGIGHWEMVASQVGTKTAEECETHYVQYYLKAKTAPLPDMSWGARQVAGDGAGPAAASSKRGAAASSGAVSPSAPKARMAGSGKTVPAVHRDAYATNVAPPAEEEKLPPAALPFAFAGFYPNRGDFEQEHGEGSESMMAGITLYDDDSPLDRRLKTTMLRIYNTKLCERHERKKFAIDHKLVGENRLKEYRSNKEFKAIFEKLRPFIRMQPEECTWQLLDLIYDRVILTRKIRQWQEYRRSGLTKAKQVPQFAAAKRQHLAREQRRTAAMAARGGRVTPTARKGSAGGMAPDALAALDGAASLSLAEAELCQSHAILPSQFHRLKATLLVEGDRRGVLSYADACAISLLRPAKTAAVYAHLVTSGWIESADPLATNPAPPPVATGGRATVVPPAAAAAAPSDEIGLPTTSDFPNWDVTALQDADTMLF